MKRCTKCKDMVPDLGYSPDKRAADGLQSQCRICMNKRSAQWRAKYPDRVCGATEKVEAHHHLGYSREHRLDIEWRCRKHHTE